jgi:transposase
VPADAVGPIECPVRSFGAFTGELDQLVEWLLACKVTTVAMESTGVYWIPLYQKLEAAGLEVVLVNARHLKQVPGRKTDLKDCQWIQQLHSYGLLNGSFRPDDAICRLRTLIRHRGNVIAASSEQVMHMQRSLDQMNVHLHHVISDLDGETGLRILDAILSGQRDPKELVKLRDPRVRKSTVPERGSRTAGRLAGGAFVGVAASLGSLPLFPRSNGRVGSAGGSVVAANRHGAARPARE